jgi:hypothetical protein
LISKEDAIALLDKYLELEYNVDPIRSQLSKLRAHRLSIFENDYCWIIPMCDEKEMNLESFKREIGRGIFYVDKETADIFEIRSAPHIPFEEDFIYFKEHGHSLLDWFPLRNIYIVAKVKTHPAHKSEPFQLKSKYETRAIETKEYLLQHFEQVSDDFNKALEIRYKPIDGIECLIIVNTIHDEMRIASEQDNTRDIKSISLPFTGGFDQFTKTLIELKKWIRVNHKQLGDNTWIEVVEKNWTKDFNDWGLVAHLTFE